MKKNMFRWVTIAVLLSTVVILSSNLVAAEKKYPSRPITLACAFPPGGSGDLLNRIWGKYMEKELGVSVVPDNRPGGGGIVVTSYLSHARPDGYTLGNFGDFMVTGILLGQATYKMEDLHIIAEVARLGCVLAVPSDSPYKTVQDLIKAAKQTPVKYGHPGIATVIYMRMAAVAKYANLKTTPVPMKGEGEVITALLGKHIPAGVMSSFAAGPQAEAGRLRILMSFDEPAAVGLDPSIPDLEAVFGKDAPDITVSTYLVAPAKTPKEVIEVLQKTMAKIAKDPAFIAELKRNRVAARYTDGKTVMEKKIPAKIPVLKEIMKEAGLIK
ncbi:MAG: Tripartite tricarboxylate transporter family receptor [Syntrophorhabdus sp. PtaU1.Bin050]|jgi:tripartite-type tricarboxylate transporter receptor subunit TctC|nr:MAG: Tripartite tricarboxylate transporter family receptor [Syntrophorhabdus sp. PtaU1.Bin050]